MNNRKLSLIKFTLLSTLACGTLSATAQDVSTLSLKGRSMWKFGLGYRTKLDITKQSGLPSDSFTFDQAPLIINGAIVHFFTDNIAVEGCVGFLNGDFHLNNDIFSLRNGDDKLLFTALNIALQYYYPIGEKIRPYVGAGYSWEIGKVRPVKWESKTWDIFRSRPFTTTEQGSFEISTGGNLMLQLGIDVKVASTWYINVDFKHTLPATHELVTTRSAAEVGKSVYTISRADLTVGIGVLM